MLAGADLGQLYPELRHGAVATVAAVAVAAGSRRGVGLLAAVTCSSVLIAAGARFRVLHGKRWKRCLGHHAQRERQQCEYDS